MRRLIAFACAGETLVGTLDEAEGTTGVLIVSGGNELRIGAHRGMAELAARLAAAGVPVLRYDRRGIGDSSGENGGFEDAADDLAAAVAAFQGESPQITRVVAFGNCDAATTLALFGSAAGVDAIALSNPWLGAAGDDLPPSEAIRARYLDRLKDPQALLRLVTGGVSITKLVIGLRKAAAPMSRAPLEQRMADALATFPGAVDVLLAARDNTAVAFRTAWNGPGFAVVRARAVLHEHDTASHSYQHDADKDWLLARLLAAAHSAA
jgi:exosortase A-associated hydrolase 1